MKTLLKAAAVLPTALLLASALRGAAPAPATPAISAKDLQFFESKIRPVLVDKCYKCHSKDADKVRGGLILDTREGLMHGGNTGPAIEPGNPGKSLLIDAISYKNEDLQMPPKGEKLSDQQIADLTEWVRRGAPDPRTLVSKGSSAAYGGVGKNHWSFQPLKKPEIPEVQNKEWVKNPIDNFVLAKLEANGMTPNVPADKATLIRRVYFDLIGLPPHPSEVIAFAKDTSPDAYEKLVDRLLASPQYGEHWARYWLDVARYSDTKGDAPGQEDLRYPHAWTYRDWVIDAFNADLRYDYFIIAQIAGDRFNAILENQKAQAQKKAASAQKSAPMQNVAGKPADVAGSDEPAVELPKVEVKANRVETRPMLAAEGFLTLGNQFNGRRDDIIGDQIDVTTKAFLGLTVGCARCHDHKFDPIPTKDYYSLYGIFANSVQPKILPTMQTKVPATTDYADYLAKAAELQKRQAQYEEDRREFARSNKGKGKAAVAGNTTRREMQQKLQRTSREISRDMATLDIEHPGSPARANALFDTSVVNPNTRSHDYPVLLRGEAQNKGDIVPRRFLEILSPDPKHRPEWHNGSGRWELALAIADPKNPLTARVFVNRMWQQHWGAGFVPTPDDLGNMSAPPTHPELLDWLASTFIENKWSIKSLHRMIVLSAAYQQSSQNNPKYAEQDPNNKLLWRYNLRRMDFEEMHDSLLAITGELDLTYGGKPVAISSEGFAKRRAIYTMIDRTNPPELLMQFDFPNPDVEAGRRYETLVPQQALFLMNSPMVIETARKLVDRPAFAELKNDQERVVLLYLAIFQRWPTKQEVEIGLKYVKANPNGTELQLTSEMPAAEINKRDARIAAKKAEQEKMAEKMVGKKGANRFNTQVGGIYDNKTPLDAWTKLAHALFQTNESMFYN
jgi:cytochrome c553